MSEKLVTIANNILSLVDYTEKSVSNKERLQHLNYILEEIEDIENLTNSFHKGKVSLLERKKLLHELHLNENSINRALSGKIIKNFYQGHFYGKVSNIFFEPLTNAIFSFSPSFEKRFHSRIMESGINSLSTSYISMMLFTSFNLLLIGSLVGVFLLLTLNYTYGILLGIILSSLSLVCFAGYPSYRINYRKRKLNSEFPFIVNHFAALASSGVKDVGLFRSLIESKYFHCLAIDLRRIVNLTTLLGHPLHESILIVSKSNPSKNFRKFFGELAQTYEKRLDTKKFLVSKSKLLLSQYRLSQRSKKTKIITIFEEITNSFQGGLKDFKILISLILGLSIIFLSFFVLKYNLYLFVSLLIFGSFLGWTYPSFKIYKTLNKNRNLEHHFFNFARDFKRKKHILDIDGKYGKLTPHVNKLVNQYKIGIPFEKCLQNLSIDCQNKLILGAVAIALEAKKHGASIPETLDLIVSSKTTRNILKMQS